MSQKRSPIIFWITQKLTDFNDFGVLNPDKSWHKMLQICPPHLSDVATLPREIQKSHFRQYYSYIFRLFVISEEKLYQLAHPTWKCHHTNLWIVKLFHLLRSFKRCRLWKEPVEGCRRSVTLKRTGCDVWQLQCKASSVTASVQSHHLLR